MHYGAKIFAEVATPAGFPQIEKPVRIERIHAECWGTPDYRRYDPDVKTLDVAEYKYGHLYVDPFENFQMIAYATGALSQLGVSPGADDVSVRLTVVQPRAFHSGGPVQSWTTTAFGLEKLVQRARAAAAQALGPEPPTVTGPHCALCRARHICGTLRKSAAHIVDYSGTADADELDTVSAAVELRIVDEAADRLAARRTGLAVQVEAELRAGRRVPGWGLEPGRSKLDWNPDVSVPEVASLGSLIGVDLLKPPALVTPTQAKTAGLAEDIVSGYATRRPGAMKLKPDNGTAARKVFGRSESEKVST
jgi:hypothetical protein